MSRTAVMLSNRLREIRLERFGEHGIPFLAGAMGLPAQTWENYEAGVQIPGWAMLKFVEVTDVDPHWLLTGEGQHYSASSRGSCRQSGS